MKPEQRIEEKKTREAVQAADALSTEGVSREIANLKGEVGATLVRLSDRLESEIRKYVQVKEAVAAREKELQEIYEIEKTATTLGALIEAQQQKRTTFETEMVEQREEFDAEMAAKREAWEKERQAAEAEIRERGTAEKKRREREADEWKYQFEREQQLARERFDYDKAKLEREVQFRREELEKDLAAREKALAGSEAELVSLRERIAAFPKELDTAVAKAVEEASARLNWEAKTKDELLRKAFEGEKNVFTAKIEALQQTVKEQTARIAATSAQLEKSYGQVQDIAVKAIEGSSTFKAFGNPAMPLADSVRRSGQSEG